MNLEYVYIDGLTFTRGEVEEVEGVVEVVDVLEVECEASPVPP